MWMSEKEMVVRHIIQSGKTVAVAESCTGGMLSAAITDVAGVSSVFLEGVVTYANAAKVRLGVQEETLAKHGAVSRETAAEMAVAVRKRSGADIGISTTGIAGPGGGRRQKPVGLVYVGISYAGGTAVATLRLGGNRETIRKKTVAMVFKLVKEII
ncbi:MAG: nicotinamide-nucleotide amidohydrolase family protein [Clostridia bacterium]|nr:nicotinamide-nucleotide amidohydrolase family protein [Clostridia bacterium]